MSGGERRPDAVQSVQEKTNKMKMEAAIAKWNAYAQAQEPDKQIDDVLKANLIEDANQADHYMFIQTTRSLQKKCDLLIMLLNAPERHSLELIEIEAMKNDLDAPQ